MKNVLPLKRKLGQSNSAVDRLWGICFIVKGRTFSTPDRPKKTEAKLGSEVLNPGVYLSRCRVSIFTVGFWPI